MSDDNQSQKLNGKREMFRPLIGVLYLIGTFIIFGLALAGRFDPQWKDVGLMIIGALITKSGTIVDWAFGGSQDSTKKTDVMLSKFQP